MNTIDRPYTPVSGLSALDARAEPQRLQQANTGSGGHSNLIDFSPPQKTSGVQSALNMASVQPPSASSTRESPSGNDELLLNKLVDAIRTIFQELFSRLRGNQSPGSAPSTSTSTAPAPAHSEQPKAIDRASSTPAATATPTLLAAKGQGADMSGMVGFAKEANTTGGNKGEVVTVNTVADLKKNLEDDTARTVRLGANLSADSKVTINFGANKTLLGTDSGNGLHNIYLASGKTASNDIFQNLDFTHDSRYRENGDMQMFISSGKNYWIDHNTYTGTKDQNPKGLDKLLYVGGTADNVSLTNSKFQNNEYGVILGQPDDSAAAKAAYAGYPRMTIANNAFNNLDVRAPGLMRHGNFDVYNNLIDNFHLGFTATGDANILSQANYFEHGVDVASKPSNTGVLDDYGDAHFKDIGSNVSFTQKSPVTTWTPSYQRDVKTAEQAKAYDLANAGATPVK